MSADEEWRPIAGFEGLFEVSSFGRVKRLGRTVTRRRLGTEYSVTLKSRIVPHRRRGSRRPTVDLQANGEPAAVLRVVHLVLDAFEIDVPPDHGVEYLNGDTDDCSLQNLAVVELTEPGEVWREIPSTPSYHASSHGRIRSLTRRYERTFASRTLSVRHFGRILTQPISKQRAKPKWAGYPTVNVNRKMNNRSIPVHHLIAEAFLGPRPGNQLVCHRDGNSLNPRPDNLYYGSVQQNLDDMNVKAFADLAGLTIDDAWAIIAKRRA
jgi:hypothetical protein